MDPTSPNTTEHVDVAIVGAGISGVSAAWHIQTRCPTKRYTILEAHESLGGTWSLFTYPGLRSDSDMYSLGFRFRPYTGKKAIADGATILSYITDTAVENGIDKHIRFGHRLMAADWSNDLHRWTLSIDHNGQQKTLTCSFLICTGYFDHDHGHAPDFPGATAFTGPIVHPQHWPTDLDYAGRNVVVIGSGATAVTMIPALIDSGAGHVTMLQRSPTYILSLPDTDPLAVPLQRVLSAERAYTLLRWKQVLQLMATYQLCRRWPHRMRSVLLRLVRRQLPPGYDVDQHFGPRYNPWEQRMCLVPNGDFFRVIRDGQADIVTDTIERFTATGIELTSGTELPADIVVTATGFNLQFFGGAALSIDGDPVQMGASMGYKGTLMSGLPNFTYMIGYTNASWTLKADLESEYICRLINHMDANGFASVVPVHPDASVEERPWLTGFTPGYAMRAVHMLPKQGSRTPWRIHQNYIRDIRVIRHHPIADENLRFEKAPIRV